jgi:hypothetical protein
MTSPRRSFKLVIAFLRSALQLLLRVPAYIFVL